LYARQSTEGLAHRKIAHVAFLRRSAPRREKEELLQFEGLVTEIDLLAPVYRWFTEGHDTLDLKEAKTLLDELHV
jgi:hypothetical protein